MTSHVEGEKNTKATRPKALTIYHVDARKVARDALAAVEMSEDLGVECVADTTELSLQPEPSEEFRHFRREIARMRNDRAFGSRIKSVGWAVVEPVGAGLASIGTFDPQVFSENHFKVRASSTQDCLVRIRFTVQCEP